VVVVLVGDTSDRGIGKSVAGALYSFAELFTKESVKRNVREVVRIDGANFRHQSILDRVNALTVRPEDTLFCLICCHGAFDRKNGDYANGHWFHADRPLPRKALRAALVRKGAALTCLLSESCNVEVPMPPTSAFMKSVELDANVKLTSLLFGPRGVIDLNSSKAGEYSFTGVFSPMLHEALTEKPVGSWVDTRDGKRQTAFPRTIPPERRATWKELVAEVGAGANTFYRLVRGESLANPRVSAADKRMLQGQADQTVTVFEYPR
ncbi:MAG: hypothetical protein ACRC33_03880, partial [Gemmataceae bacterium]